MPINERGEFVRERSVGGAPPFSPGSPQPLPQPPDPSPLNFAGWAVAAIAILALGWTCRLEEQSTRASADAHTCAAAVHRQAAESRR